MTETNQERAREAIAEWRMDWDEPHRPDRHEDLANRLTALLDERDREHDPLALAARYLELEGALREIASTYKGHDGWTAGDYAEELHACQAVAEHALSAPSPAVEAVREVLRYGLVAIEERGQGHLEDELRRHFPALVAGLEGG